MNKQYRKCSREGCLTDATAVHQGDTWCDMHYLEVARPHAPCPMTCRNETHDHPRAIPFAPTLSGHDDVTHDRFGYQQGCSICNPRCAVMKCKKPSTTIFDRVPFCDEHAPKQGVGCAYPGTLSELRDVVRNEQTTAPCDEDLPKDFFIKAAAKKAHYLQRENLINYLKDCLQRNDWHAVSDAANDLRVLEAQEPK